MNIPIEEYVVLNNPKASKQLLAKYGVPSPTSIEDMITKVQFISQKYRGEGLMEIASIDTPYRRLILASIDDSDDEKQEDAKTESKSNCVGCGGTCGAKKSNIDGEDEVVVAEKVEVKKEEPVKTEVITSPKKESNDAMEKYFMPAIIFTGIITLLVVLTKK